MKTHETLDQTGLASAAQGSQDSVALVQAPDETGVYALVGVSPSHLRLRLASTEKLVVAVSKPSRSSEVASQIIPLDPHPKVVEALEQLEEAVGGRGQIAASLQISTQPLTVEEEILANLLADPANQSTSLAELCGRTGITIGRVLELFAKAEGAQAYAKSLSRIYRRLPDVVGDVMERALPRTKQCRACKGRGTVPVKNGAEDVEIACMVCDGTGQMEIEPELERQKIALQLGGFLKDKGGVNITTTNTTNTVNITPARSTPDFRSATDRLLYPHKERALPEPTLEAEIVNGDPDVQ